MLKFVYVIDYSPLVSVYPQQLKLNLEPDIFSKPYPTYLKLRSKNIHVPYNSSEATKIHLAKTGNTNANVQVSDNLNGAAASVVDLEPAPVSANSSGSILFF